MCLLKSLHKREKVQVCKPVEVCLKSPLFEVSSDSEAGAVLKVGLSIESVAPVSTRIEIVSFPL